MASRMAARAMASGRKKAGAATIARARTIWCRGRQLQQPGRPWKQSQAADREAALPHDPSQESSQAANKPSELIARTADLHNFKSISAGTSQRNSGLCMFAACTPNNSRADRARRGASAGRPSPRQLARPGQDGALQAHMRVFTKQPGSRRRGTRTRNASPARRRAWTVCERLLTDPRKRD